MTNLFFEKPIINSPYEIPSKHWELDKSGQPTQNLIDGRRSAKFITPIPKAKKQTTNKSQENLLFEDSLGLSDQKQQYLKSLNSTAAFNKGVEYFVEIIFFYGVLICLAYYEIRKSYLASIKDNKKKNLLKSNLKSLK